MSDYDDWLGEIEVDSPDRIALPFIGQLAGVRRTFGDAEKAMMRKLKPICLMTPQVSAEHRLPIVSHQRQG